MRKLTNRAIYSIVLSIITALFLISNIALPLKHAKATLTDAHPIAGTAALHKEISFITNSQKFAASTIGITVINLNNGQVLFEQNAGKLFHPASVMKVYTTAAALTYLGSAHKFHTRVAHLPGTVNGSTINGDLWLIGSGDPTLTSSDLMMLANKLKSIGITQITGNIICDDSAFDDTRYGKGWMWDDQPYKDFAPIGALSVNRNTIKVFISPGSKPGAPASVRLEPATSFVQINNQTTTSAKHAVSNTDQTKLTVMRHWQAQENIIDVTGTMPSKAQEQEFTRNIVFPAVYTGTLFKEALGQNGIRTQGSVIKGEAPIKSQLIVEHISEALSEIIIGMNKDSHNLDAELLLKSLGSAMKGDMGSDEKGFEAISGFLADNGDNLKTTRFADGSGVSRYNLVTPANLAALLKTIYNSPTIRHDLIASLPIAGVDGNLKNRMKNSAALTKVQAKTGAMTGVSSLAGYAQALDGTQLAFVIMMEHFIGSHQPFLRAQDQICDILCRYIEK